MFGFSGRAQLSRPRAGLGLGLLALGLWYASVAASPTPPAGGPLRGEPLYRRYCAVCHGPDGRGDGPNASFVGEDRPRDLTDARYMGRRSDEHLERAIAGGGQAIDASRFMPAWRHTLSASQIHDLVAYVRALSAPARGSPAPQRTALDGARLAGELGCPTCHRIGGLVPLRVAPDLAAEGSRVQRAWLHRFLRAPHTIRPAGHVPLSRSRMPDFRLSEAEAGALAEYLSTQRDGHLEPPQRSTMSATVIQRGRDLFSRYACRACHTLDGEGGRAGPDLSSVAGRLRPGWVMRFVQKPQDVDALSPMPRVGLDEADAWAITRFLFGPALVVAEPPPDDRAVARGRRLFAALGCAGCHANGREALERPGPDLSAAGDKLTPTWLAEFLARPSTVRPWIAARMPDFRLTVDETATLAAYLGNAKNPGAPRVPERLAFRGSVSAANVEAGRRLASRAYLSCSSCHVGEERPEGPPEEWAPDLRLSARRLHPDWIVLWLLDPQRLAPGTKMPAYFSDAGSGPEEILEGDEERQAVALRDYILALDGVARSTELVRPPLAQRD